MNDRQLEVLWENVASLPCGADGVAVHVTRIVSHGNDVCVGLDRSRLRHLLIPLPNEGTARPAFRSAGLHVSCRALLRNSSTVFYVDLICLSPRLDSVFSHLVLDVLHDMKPDEPDAAAICLRVLQNWKDLFGSGSSGLGEDQIIGLAGELLVLDRLTSVNPGRLTSWVGPAGGIHDFRYERSALEVKTSTRRHGRFFRISGHQQLEPPGGGSLHLIAIKLERNPGGSISLPKLVERIRHNGVDPQDLATRLADVGYAAGQDARADSDRFDEMEFHVYAVDQSFPRIIADSFADRSLPLGVISLAYDIDLSSQPPKPLSPADAESVLRDFATGGAA